MRSAHPARVYSSAAARLVLCLGGMPRDIQQRAFSLAVEVCGLERDDAYRGIVRRVLVAQLVRAVTSVGANLEEATGALSKADFIAKVGVARKEARETQYWLRLGQATGVIQAHDWPSLLKEAEEVSRVVAAIVRSAKRSTTRGEPRRTTSTP